MLCETYVTIIDKKMAPEIISLDARVYMRADN